jgi:hypothetical protein
MTQVSTLTFLLLSLSTKPYPSAYAARNFHGTMLSYARNFLQRLRASVRLRYQKVGSLSLTPERFGICV